MRKPLFFLLLLVTSSLWAQHEKTSVQSLSEWKPTFDVRSDVVMVYGANDRPTQTFRERVQTWRDHGYITHFMSGIAWGPYWDYFSGQWDGTPHMDEAQVTALGDTLLHGPNSPYIVPTMNFLNYLKEKHVKRVIDAGIDDLFFEEPEFWARGGYSEAFKREWEQFYGFAWRPQHASAADYFLSSELKYYLYYRALDEVFTFAKAYGREQGREVRCYVPTHSLLNYANWGIVSPEASLASMKSCDGYIAQVWTGTSRTPNYYNGVSKERVFEMAFLEYGCMESMTRPTGRKMIFLTDPIEDRAVDWEDYRRNYQATFVAQLLYPMVDNYEMMPWPERIYERLYRTSPNSEEKSRIPRFYSTQVQVMVNAFKEMPKSDNKVSGSQGISVLLANSLMFQQTVPNVEGYDEHNMSNFFGLALPLIKQGIPVGITHLENVGYEETWRDLRVLLMTYSNMKPLDPEAHRHIADWVRQGGTLLYCGRDDDAFQRVPEWWNTNGNRYAAPSEHLFSLMGIDPQAAEGHYRYGQGQLYVLRHNPKEFVLNVGADSLLLQTLEAAYGAYEKKNAFRLDRGPYTMAAVVDESLVSDEPVVLKGRFIDLFDPKLPVVTEKTVQPGEQAFLFDINKVAECDVPKVLAAASRQYDEVPTPNSFSFTAKSPIDTDNVMRILLPSEPKKVEVGVESRSSWDEASHTLLLEFANHPEGVQVTLEW